MGPWESDSVPAGCAAVRYNGSAEDCVKYLFLVATVAACGGSWVESEAQGLRVLDGTRTSRLSGSSRLSFDVFDGETAFLVSVDPESPNRGVFLELRDPDKQTVFDIDVVSADPARPKTGAQFSLSTTSINWPTQQSDGPLASGGWRADVGLISLQDTFESGADSDVRVVFKQDASFDIGELRVRVVYVGPVGEDDELVSATEAAVQRWETLYAAFGITLVARFDVDGFDGPIGAPGQASAELFERLSAASELGEVTLVVADQIDDNPNIQGFSGGIPGPILPSGRSVMVLSALDNSGGDLVFTSQETQLYAETMAHEVGHFIGLFHPVELTFDQWDGLDDTPECASRQQCFSSELAQNLMFPVPLIQPNGETIPQTNMTTDQRGVMHRSVWVN